MRGLALLPILFLCGCAAAIAGPAQPVPARINGRGVAIAAIGLALAEGKSTPKPAQASPVPRVEAPVSDPEFPPATPHHPAPADDGWDVPKIAQPILEPEPEVAADIWTGPPKHGQPIEIPPGSIVRPVPERPVQRMLFFTRERAVQRCNGRSCTFDHSERLASDRVHQQLTRMHGVGWKIGKTPWNHVQIVDIDEDPQTAAKWKVTAAPVLVMTVNGAEVSRYGYLTGEQFAEIWNQTGTVYEVRPGPERRRPTDNRWRAHIPRQAAQYSASIHTQLSLGSIDLPTTKINLLGQAIEFVDTKESQLNEWFSILFKAGTVKHEGSSVVFSAPPQVNLRLPFNRSFELAALKSIEFVPGGADLHTDRMTIPFRVK